MTTCRTSKLNDLDSRQSDVLEQLEQLDRQIEYLLLDWTSTTAAELSKPAMGNDEGHRAAA